ncbi:uncharacterized protein LOC107493071 [Arachis duranensis]|uniref:Uncharacterized protein LOC107493071 n=1 Tax=Arachis duranensis TaxID=130453 RepID=A0A6P4DUN5_ARADU|nr:uncharacterized protein LOC107493071 [Arachis duranensis]
MAHSKHIDKVLDRHSNETIANNCLRLKASIDAILWLAFQACAFRGDDEKISSVLSRHNLDVQNLRRQGYDGATKEVCYIHKFFSKLTLIVNVVTVSPKHHDQLRVAQANNVANLIADDQLVTGSGLNQIGTLQRIGDTRWGSHLNSVRSLLCMFDATYEVLEKSTEEGNFSNHGDASAAYDAITSFEFVFVLHLMRNILEVSYDLCQALQRKKSRHIECFNSGFYYQDFNPMNERIKLGGFHKRSYIFCEKHEVEVPDMNALHIPRRGRTRKIVDQISVEHHYCVNLFFAVIDIHLQELNRRFNDNMVELLTLSSTLDPRDNYKFFSVNKLCQRLTKTANSLTYPLIDRLIRLVLTLPVSTATTERSFSAMNIVKNRLRNKMKDEFLANCLLIYIEKKIAERFDTDSIIDEFYDMKNRRLYLLLVLVDDDFVYEMLLWLLKIDLMNKNLRYVVIDEMLKNGCTYDMKLRYIELRVLGQLWLVKRKLEMWI